MLFCTMCIKSEIAPTPYQLIAFTEKQTVLRDTEEHQFPISPPVQRLICSVALNSHWGQGPGLPHLPACEMSIYTQNNGILQHGQAWVLSLSSGPETMVLKKERLKSHYVCCFGHLFSIFERYKPWRKT